MSRNKDATLGSESGVPTPDVSTPAIDPKSAEVETELRRQFRLNQRLQVRDNIRTIWDMKPTLLNEDPYSVFKIYGGPRIASRQICNKLTLLYRGCDPSRSFPSFSGAFWKQWFYHNNPPKVDFGYYVAQSFRVTGSGPLDIPQLLTYHYKICAEAERYMRQGAHEHTDMHSMENYKVLPLCRAIMTVFDGNADDIADDITGYDENLVLGNDISISSSNPSGRGLYSLDQFARKCTVVLVRTGDESQLSTPVDFSLLNQTFPLERSDIKSDGGIEAVRVTIAAAVSFLFDLQNQEMLARPELYYNPKTDRFSNPSMSVRGTSLEIWHASSEDEWVEACHQPNQWMDHEKRWLKYAMERVRKKLNGEDNWDDLVLQDRWILSWA